MTDLRTETLRLATTLPKDDPFRRQLLAAVGKQANWWGVIHGVIRGGDALHIDVAGEEISGGSSSLTYVMKEVRGRILKLSDDVEKFVLGQPGYRDSHVSRDPSLATKDKYTYVGYGHLHVFDGASNAAAALAAVQAQFKGKAYFRDWPIDL